MDLASYIEHTLLHPDCTTAQIKQLCQEAIQYQFKGVCVPPFHVATAANLLSGTDVQVVTAVGFPMGYSAIPAKVEEVKKAIDEGVQEIDMVANICAIKDGKWAHVYNDIDGVTRATHLKGKVMKVIVEATLLTPAELQQICEICVKLGINYVKTSTGMQGGATPEMVRQIKKWVDGKAKIKASGGIRTREQAEALVQAGATRIGTSAGVTIVGGTGKK